MTQEQDSNDKLSELRTRAEESLGTMSVDHEDISQLSPEEIHRLIHELRVHQIELEMQNEELRQTQLKLEELKDKYLDLYDFAPVGYMTLNDKGLILEANLTAVGLLGLERTSLKKMSFSRFVSEEFLNPYSVYFKRIFESQAKETCEIKLKRKDGTVFHAQLESVAVQDETGHFIHCRTILSDITERKRLESDKETLLSQLLQSQKMEAVGTLAAGIAHDFNNMLQVILGYSEMLLNEKTGGEPGHTELQKIVKTSIEAKDLVQKIRLFSRKADIQPVAVDLNLQLAELVKLLSHTLQKTCDIDAHLGENLDLIKADPALMDQMVTNLAINASEAMPDGGTLTIETQNVKLDDDFWKTHLGLKPGPHVQLTISDTGRGMSKDLLDRIFEPFFSTKQRDYRRGTGLGLSIVKGIVDEHGGYITVESEVGKGTTFKIYFPILAVQQQPAMQTVTKADVASVVGETILLVEDEELVRDFMIGLLEQFGYKVIAVRDGQEAVEVYAQERDNIALVILDIVMPRMDGKECLQGLLKINPSVKVLISTGVAQDDRVKEVVDLGAKGSLLKPYGMKVLKDKVGEVIDAD